MTCASFEGFDLLAYLDDPRAESFAAFRAHYPGCPECAAEVRESTELRQLLEGARSAHPDPELLLRFEDARGGLAAQEAARIESHLQSCITCREELDSLRGLDAAALGHSPAAPLRVRPTLGARLRWLLWQPALAYALLFAALAPQLYRAFTSPAPPLPAQSRAPAAREEKPSVPRMTPEPAAGEGGPPAAATPARPATSARADDASLEVPSAPAVPTARPAPPPKAPPPPARPAPEPEVREKEASDARGLERNDVADEAPPAPEPVEPEREGLISGRLDRDRAQPRADSALETPDPGMQRFARSRSAPKPLEPAVTLTRGTDSIEVRVPLPDFARPGITVVLVIRDAAGRRELREIRKVSSGDTFLSTDLPVPWATPGSYQAEVLDPTLRDAPTSATYSFTID